MTCAACVATIENVVTAAVSGVSSVNINLATGNSSNRIICRLLRFSSPPGRALVRGSQEVTAKAVVTAIEDVGFSAKEITSVNSGFALSQVTEQSLDKQKQELVSMSFEV